MNNGNITFKYITLKIDRFCKLFIKLLAYTFGKRHVDSWEKDEFTCLLNENSNQ